MIPNIALQEIHDQARETARKIAECSRRPETDWQAMWTQRGHRLMALAAELDEMTRQRDMLAQRCAELTREKYARAAPFAPQLTQTVADAIATMQKQGIR